MKARELYEKISELKTHSESIDLEGYRKEYLNNAMDVCDRSLQSKMTYELLDFCECHVNTSLELFGGIRIYSKAKRVKNGFVIGSIEILELTIENSSGKVFLIDTSFDDSIPILLAPTNEAFLDVVLELVRFTYKAIVNNGIEDRLGMYQVLSTASKVPNP